MANESARRLRHNLTEAETRLWCHLRKCQLAGCKFRRQAPVGPYILDFVCFQRKLVIELDGGQHTLQRERDAQRTAWLNSQGFRVLRFWNYEVMDDLETVLEVIWNALNDSPQSCESIADRHPHPGPPPSRGRE